jgi:hypothetical protein
VGTLLSENPTFSIESFGTELGSASASISDGIFSGLVLETNGDAGHHVLGYSPRTTSLLSLSYSLNTSYKLRSDVTIGTSDELAGGYFIGYTDTLLNASGGSDSETREGGWFNSAADVVFGFWFENGANEDKWCAVYRGGDSWARVPVVPANVASLYDMSVQTQSDGTIKFFVNGSLVHRSVFLLDDHDTDVNPVVLVVSDSAVGQLTVVEHNIENTT